jgi:hypothetical protein
LSEALQELDEVLLLPLGKAQQEALIVVIAIDNGQKIGGTAVVKVWWMLP